MKKMWILILFVFAMLSVNVYAQLPSLSELPDGKRAGGVGYANYYGSHYPVGVNAAKFAPSAWTKANSPQPKPLNRWDANSAQII